MKSPTVISIIFLINLSWASSETIKCTDTVTTLPGTSGTIEIDRKAGCLLMAGFKFFGIKTQNLRLYDGEYIRVKPGKEEEIEFNISGPIKADWYLFAYKPQLSFTLKPQNGSMDIMLIDYFQRDDLVPVNLGSHLGNTVLRSYDQVDYTVEIAASDAQMHVQVQSNHYLIKAEDKMKISVSGEFVSLAFAPVRSDCSNTQIASSKDNSFKIVGPKVETIKEPYLCVNLFEFENDLKVKPHFDINFANFNMIDQDDQLMVDDGYRPFSVNRFSRLQPVTSFQGPKLAIIYNSPRVIKPKLAYELSIAAQTIGGVIDGSQLLSLPPKGLVRYTLRSQKNDVLEISGKLGVDLKIYDTQNNILTIGAKDFNPPIVGLPEDAVVEFNVESQTSATVNYKQGAKRCSGSLFDSSGTISVSGGIQTCYWLIGKKSTIRVDYHDMQNEKSCLKIYPLDHGKPIFDQCNLDPAMVLPPFTLGPAYISIEASSNDTRFDATISKALDSSVSSPGGMQTRYSSSSYPTSYLWSPFSDNFSIDSRNKSVILSVADVDIRKGEKLTINSKEVATANYLALGDFDISNSTTNVAVSRSFETNDFLVHKGYSLVTNAYQNIVKVDVGRRNVTTQKNQTSLLVWIAAAEKERIVYSITNVTPGNQNFVMNVIDSRSVIGRRVPDEEKYNSSTTSNTLFISFSRVKDSTTLPEFKIGFSKVACNETTDHVCDQSTRCVPADKLCKGKSYCLDGTDLHVQCSSGPKPQPPATPSEGYRGFTVFFLSILMFSMGVVAAIYGPGAYKNLEGRFRPGQYTTFTSTE